MFYKGKYSKKKIKLILVVVRGKKDILVIDVKRRLL